MMEHRGQHELPIPEFYHAEHASQWQYRPNEKELFQRAIRWQREHRVPLTANDGLKTHLLLVDLQKDFCFPEGALFVAGRNGNGAVEDNQRLASFIYRNLHQITAITITMDTHSAYQIFFPSFWVDQDNQPLSAHQIISLSDIQNRTVRPNPAMTPWLMGGDYHALTQHVSYYCSELERTGADPLYLWPPHCLLGSEGHALAGIIHEARLFHSFVRGAQSWVELKGNHPLTEHYSAIRPEVMNTYDGRPIAQANISLLNTLLQADRIILAGQASSHCIKNTVEDLLSETWVRDRRLASKVYLLVDCMSAVTVPDSQGGFAVDFTLQAEEALRRFAKAGMHLASSTTPMGEWSRPPW